MKKNLAEIIKTARIKANLSPKELANLCKISRANLYYIESGKTKRPYITTLQALSQNLNLDLKNLKELCGYNFSLKYNMKLADLIKTARINANLSQKKLENLCGISHKNLSSIESGKTKQPHIVTLQVLSQNLNLDLKNLHEICGYNYDNITLGGYIKNARIKANLSQKELAKLVKISQEHLYHIEANNIKSPHLSTLTLLSEHLDISLKKLKELAGYYNFPNVQNDEPETLANVIRNARYKAKLSLNELANLCNISISCLSSIENGCVQKISISTLHALAKILNLDVEKLIKLAGYMNEYENEQKTLGVFIKNARLKSGFSVSQLADLCHIYASSLRNIENGTVKIPKFSTLQALEKHLNLDIEKLLKLAGYMDEHENEPKTLGDFIKSARLNSKISISELADLCHISSSSLHYIESGHVKKPQINTLKVLAKHLNLDLTKLKQLSDYATVA